MCVDNTQQTQQDDAQIPADGVTLETLTPPEPVLRKPEEIFDGLMSQIDPRFMLINRDSMQEQLQNASPDERVKIMQEFRQAMVKYDEKAAEYFANFKQLVSAYRNCVEDISRIIENEQADTMFEGNPT